MTKNMAETVAEGIGLSEEWALINRHRLEKEMQSNETVSDSMLSAIHDMRVEEFDVKSNETSNYEKKLVMVGFHIAQVIMQNHQNAANEALKEALGTLQDLRKNLDE
jgi:hypothetical protein